MVEWLAGNRIIGTTAERPVGSLASPSVGGWVELGRHTLGSSSATLDVSSLADKRYYMTLLSTNGLSQAATSRLRYNGNTGTTKAYRISQNGAADDTGTNINGINIKDGGDTDLPWFNVGYHANLSAKEKLFLGHTSVQSTAGAANAPTRHEMVGKQVLTTAPIDQITSFLASAGNYSTGGELVVLGWDPADTHTSNFWEELASVELGSAGDLLDSGVFAAKKYLWIQTYAIASGVINQYMRVGTTTVDTGNNYSLRYNSNGGADGILTSFGSAVIADGDDTTDRFVNLFGINNSANEKLFIGHNVNNTVGASNAPLRGERVHKWANTSGQITKVEIRNTGSGSFDTGSILKVWGSD